MNDDSWLVSKQARFLDDSIKSLHISGELMECLSILMKQMLTETEKMEIANHCPSIPRLAGKALELIRQSEEMIGTLAQDGREIDAMLKHNDLTSATSLPSSELDYGKPIARPLHGKPSDDKRPPDKLPVYPGGGSSLFQECQFGCHVGGRSAIFNAFPFPINSNASLAL
jgi:hypothetical protein